MYLHSIFTLYLHTLQHIRHTHYTPLIYKQPTPSISLDASPTIHPNSQVYTAKYLTKSWINIIKNMSTQLSNKFIPSYEELYFHLQSTNSRFCKVQFQTYVSDYFSYFCTENRMCENLIIENLLLQFIQSINRKEICALHIVQRFQIPKCDVRAIIPNFNCYPPSHRNLISQTFDISSYKLSKDNS